MSNNVSEITAKALEALLAQQQGTSADMKLESFGIFLDDYVISGGEVQVGTINKDQFTVSETIVSFNDLILRVEAKTLNVRSNGASTLFLDFTQENGLVLNTIHPTTPYLPLWQINTNASSEITDTVDVRSEMGFIRFRPEIMGIISNLVIVDEHHIASDSISTSKLKPGAVTEDKIAAKSIKAVHLADGAVTDHHISSLSFAKVIDKPTTLAGYGIEDIAISPTPPSKPKIHALWLDTLNSIWNRWDGSQWVQVGSVDRGANGDMQVSVYDTDNDGIVDAAEKLAVPRTIELVGDVTGAGLFDGSGNISIQTESSGLANRRMNSGSGLQGGGDLSADRTFSIAPGGVRLTHLAAEVTDAMRSGSGTPSTTSAGITVGVYLTSPNGEMHQVGVDNDGRIITETKDVAPPQNWNPLNDSRLATVETEIVDARSSYASLDARLDAIGAGNGSAPAWSAITDKPTTVIGFGIEDAATLAANTYSGDQSAPNFVGRINGVKITVAAAGPVDPIINDVWLDTVSGSWNRWNGSSWVGVGGGGSTPDMADHMMKSTYDTDGDGIVDAAESVPWSGVTGKPSTTGGYGITNAITTAGGQTIGGSLTATNFIGEMNGVKWSVGNAAPGAPQADDMWVDTLNSVLKRWDGAAWVAIGGSGGTPTGTGTTLATALPGASVTYRGQQYLITGAAGVADALYVCMKLGTDTYDWIQLR